MILVYQDIEEAGKIAPRHLGIVCGQGRVKAFNRFANHLKAANNPVLKQPGRIKAARPAAL